MLTLNCKGHLLKLDRPLVMGILNLTPDSFFEASRQSDSAILKNAEQMIQAGADLLDIGGQSTRPGSSLISEEEELRRVISSIEKIHTEFPEVPLSIDSFYSRVVRAAVDAGASIVNDVSGGRIDPEMFDAVADLKVPYVLTHSRGTPQNMNEFTDYGDVLMEVLDYFIFECDILKKKGIKDIIIDPGFGFAKTIEQNFTLLHHLEAFKILGYPVLVGISRKGTIYKTLGIQPEQALNGTTVLHTVALMKGAAILRVHDVKEAREAITLLSHLK